MQVYDREIKELAPGWQGSTLWETTKDNGKPVQFTDKSVVKLGPDRFLMSSYHTGEDGWNVYSASEAMQFLCD